MSSLIPRNTAIPNKVSKIFSTAEDNQDSVQIIVFEGERPMTESNHRLGAFNLGGILPAKRGVPEISVTFEIDVNGILRVSAEDRLTKLKQSIIITNDQLKLTPTQIERMVQEANKFSKEDRDFKEKVDARHNLEDYLYGIKLQLDESKSIGSSLSEREKQTMSNVVKEKIAWLESHQNARLQDYKTELQDAEDIVGFILAKLTTRKQGSASAGGSLKNSSSDQQTSFDAYYDEL